MTVLKHEVDTDGYNATPENLRAVYQPVEGSEGSYQIPEGLRGVADAITGLFGTNTKIRGENKELLRKGTIDLSGLADFGEDLPTITETVKAKMEELETAAAAGKEGKLNVDKVRQEMKGAMEKAVGEEKKVSDALRGTVHKYLVTSGASEALAAEGGMVDLAMPFVQNQVKVVEEDGEFKAVVVDADGDPRISGGTGQPMSIRELVKEMKAQEKYAPLFKSDTKGGGGALPGQPKKPAPGAKPSSPVDKIKAGLAARNK